MTRVIILVLLSINTQLFTQKPPQSAIYDYDSTKSFFTDMTKAGLPYDQAHSTWIHTLHRSKDQRDRDLALVLATDSVPKQTLQEMIGQFEQRTTHTHMDSVRLQALSIALQRQERLTRKNTEESPNKEHMPAQPSRPKSSKDRSQGPSGKGLRRACRQSKTS